MPPDDDSLQRIATLKKRITSLEQQLAAARVQQVLLDDRVLTLERNRLFRLWNRLYRAAANLYGRIGAGDHYGGLSDLRTPGDFERWVNREQHELSTEDHRATAAQWHSQPLISIWIPAGEPALNSLQSVFEQCYPNWELCLPAQLMPALKPEIDRAQARTRILANPAEFTGDYLLTLHAGDRLSPHALHFYAQALQDDPAAILYSDEDHIAANGSRTDPLFKPGWSPDLLHTPLYPGRSVLYPRSGGLSLSPSSSRVHHIPRILYHRASSTPLEVSTPTYTAPPDARLSLIICTRQIRQLRECVKAVRKTAAIPIDLLVVHHLESASLESDSAHEMRRYVEKSGGTWLPYRGSFDFARMNNLAAAKTSAPYLLFMNDDVIVRQRGWDHALTATLVRPDIGIAGAILQYPNGTLQHAGVVLGMGDAAGHCGRFQMNSHLWPWLRMTRDVTAVTGAMLAIRADLFQQLRGFDAAFPVNYNDVDLCLRVRQTGLRVVCLDLGTVVHRESQTRIGGTRYQERDALYIRWPEVLARPDEFYSPHLAPMERIALNTEGPANPLTLLE